MSGKCFVGFLIEGGDVVDGACKYESSHRVIQRLIESLLVNDKCMVCVDAFFASCSPRYETCMYLRTKCALKRGLLLLTIVFFTFSQLTSQASTRALSQAGSSRHRRSFLSTCPDYLSDPRDGLLLACPVLPS